MMGRELTVSLEVYQSAVEGRRVMRMALRQSRAEVTVLEQQMKDLRNEKETMLTLIERNRHNFWRMGAMGSSDLNVVIDALKGE